MKPSGWRHSVPQSIRIESMPRGKRARGGDCQGVEDLGTLGRGKNKGEKKCASEHKEVRGRLG